MRWIALLLILSSAAEAQRLQRFCSRTSQGRTARGFACDSFAFFEAFPANGAGTTGACSTTAPTGAKGEALTFTRATGATCTTGTNGTRTTGIADAALVEMASGQIRQELDADGVVGVRVEQSTVNLLTRFIAIDNAAWANVGTPTLTTGQTSPFVGTYATSAVQIDDNAAGAFEGRSQAVTVSAGAAHTMHCYVKAGTLDQARISLDGTTADITGLSTSTWDIITVTDASSSGVSISAQILAGDAAGDTGTIIAGGCQVEAGSIRTSIVPTVGTTVTRNAEVISFAPTWPTSASISWANSFVGTTPTSGSAATTLEFNGIPSLLNEAGGAWRWFCGGLGQTATLSSSLAGLRTYAWHDGSNRAVVWGPNASGTSADVDATNKFATTLYIGGLAGNRPNGIISRVCVDPDATRCR